MNLKIYQLLPRRLLTKIMFCLARIKCQPIKNLIIWVYMKITGAKTDFAKEKNPFHYLTLNDFFTRELADDARPISPDEIISPVDGRCAVYSEKITDQTLFQAKEQSYSLSALLGSDEWANIFDGGVMTTLYLAPDDYHRIHMPCDGTLRAMRYCSGDVHTVSISLLDKIPNIFAGNERVVCLFDTRYGKMAMVLVGALNVSSISTVWHGDVLNAENNLYDYSGQHRLLRKGQEMGRFNLGSTVILLFQADLRWEKALFDGRKILMGQAIAHSL